MVFALLWETFRKLRYGGRTIINGTVMTYTLIMLYFVLPATSQIINLSFFCQAFDDGTKVESFMKVRFRNLMRQILESHERYLTKK